jgi:transposase
MAQALSAKPKAPVTDDGWRIPDALWERIAPLLPPRKPHPLGCHNPRVDDRKAMDAIFFVLRTACQWNALNATGICSSSSAHRRFQEWVEAGVFRELWRRGLLDYDELAGIDWEWQAIDGAMTKAPLGGEKDGQESHRPRQVGGEALGPDRWGRGAAGRGRRRGERARQVAGGRDAPESAGDRARADGRGAAAPVRRQGV